MQKIIPAAFVTCLFLLNSCKTSRETAISREAALQDAREGETGCFVEMNDGTVKSYSTLQLVTGICSAPHLLADNTIKIYPGEIKAYQNNKLYAVYAGTFSYGGHKSNLAVETLPGFAVRIASGKLNVYVKKYKTGQAVVDEYFLQEGNGQVLVYTPELMESLIKNNPSALDFFNEHYKSVRLTKQLKTTAFIFNRAYFDTDAPAVDPRSLANGPKRRGRK